MKNFVLIITLLVSFTIQGQKKYFKTIGELKANTEKIANSFINKEYEDLFNGMKPYWVLEPNEIDTLKTKTKNYQEFFYQRLGNGIDAIKIKEQNLKDILFKESYILRYQKSALRIVLIYYKSNLGWAINSFNWDDKFLQELD